MNIEVSNKILLAAIPLYFADKIRKRLTMPNPKYDEAVKMKRYVGNISRELKCYEDTQEGMIIPRGFVLQLIRMATQHEVSWEIIDRRRSLPEVPFTFCGSLRDYQDEAVQAILQHDFGTLSCPTGGGKTIIALRIIAAREQPTLVVCHTKELLNQWCDRACQFLKMELDEIGIIGNGKKRIGEKLTIGIVNSIYPIADEIKDKFGFVVVDEAHHCPSRTFTEAISAFDCRFMLGLSATPYRRDGLTKLIYWYLGDQVHAVDKARLIQEGNIMKPEIITRRTGFVSEYDLTTEYSRGISELTRDPERNRLIVSDVANYLQDNAGPCLVLSDRKSHCEVLAEMLTVQGIKTAILMGSLSAGKRKEIMETIRAGRAQAIVATGSLVGEGFDLPALSALFMATPLKFSGRVTQYVGRVLRPAPSKDRAVIFDYQDINEPVLMSAARSRMKVYQRAA